MRNAVKGVRIVPENKDILLHAVENISLWTPRKVEAMFIFQEPPVAIEDDFICFHHHDQSAINTRYFLEHHNIDPKRIYLTNAILHGSKEIKATQKVKKACSEILRRQIDSMTPNIIVAFGDMAAWGLERALGIEKLEYLPKIRKVLRESKVLKVCKTYHLSGLNFSANKLGQEIENHWKKLAKMLPQKRA